MSSPQTRALSSLQKAVGDERARTATADDAVDGVPAALVVEPSTVEEVREVMLVAREHGLRLVARGAGTKLGWGAPPEALDLLVDVRRLDAVLEHAAGDLITRVQPGTRLADLQARLAEAGQMLALDPPEAGATVGGIVAANASGPMRLRYGTVRDLLIGSTVVLADGTVAKSGGKVVKNVAGYDIGKLLTGSYGTLGVIVETAFRLHPAPQARGVAVLPADDPAATADVVARLKRSKAEPVAVELDVRADGAGTLAVLFEGIGPAVDAQVERTLGLAGGGRAEPAVPEWFGRRPWSDGDVGVKVAYEPAALEPVLRTLREMSAAVRGSAASGVLYAAWPAGPDGSGVPDAGNAGGGAAAGALERLRAAVASHGGSVVVLAAPPVVKATLDVWGPVGGALATMRRVKDGFDPERRLSPGRFVGGI